MVTRIIFDASRANHDIKNNGGGFNFKYKSYIGGSKSGFNTTWDFFSGGINIPGLESFARTIRKQKILSGPVEQAAKWFLGPGYKSFVKKVVETCKNLDLKGGAFDKKYIEKNYWELRLGSDGSKLTQGYESEN